MDPETLVTFLFRAPTNVRTVELVGSWDNFSRPYTMHRDRRRGPGSWTGCFKFQDIVFDGVEANWSRPRTGGLKQGGTYWYYFRLDDDVEAYDDSRECTTACPLMPGQMVNVIFVPREIVEAPARNRSASLNLAGTLARVEEAHTMEPEAKFAALDPPAVSRVHARCVSDMALNGRLEGKPMSSRLSIQSPPPSTERECLEGKSVNLEESSQWVAPEEAPSSPFLRSPLSSPERPPTRHSGPISFGFTDSSNAPPTSHDVASETSSVRPRSIANIRFHSFDDITRPPTRKFSLHNPDLQQTYTHCSTSSASPVYSPLAPSSPTHDPETGFSPTFSAATVSSSGGGVNTPFNLNFPDSDRDGGLDPRKKTAWVNEASFEDVAARLRSLERHPISPPPPARAPPPPPTAAVQTYQPTGMRRASTQAEVPRSYALPVREPTHVGQGLPNEDGVPGYRLPMLAAGRGLDGETSLGESIFSELGYLGGAIR